MGQCADDTVVDKAFSSFWYTPGPSNHTRGPTGLGIARPRTGFAAPGAAKQGLRVNQREYRQSSVLAYVLKVHRPHSELDSSPS